ncbi:MAG: type III secretion system stator protein SctL [Deltaproteobacteria bacterium]|nr:MAG: type III secretion system stator protein SctL [Deltaproteobacteria bacterium]
MIVKRLQFDSEFEPLLTGSPVIKFRAMKASEQASSIIQNAKKEAENIKAKAQEVYEQAEQHYEDERQRGYEEGREEGRGEWSEKLMEASMAKEKMLEDAEPQVIRMVMDIAEKVIGRAVEKGAVIEVIKKTIEESSGKKITVRVNPQDWEMVKSREQELVSGLDQRRSISVREDESVGVGGCIVETELGTVDARLELQLKAIRNALGL